MQLLKLPGPKAKAIIERDQATISPSYPRGYPFVMDHGKGTEVWDVDGNRFLDFAAGIAVASTGHSHPEVVRAIQDQASEFIHISSDFYHETWVRLAERFNDIAPFDGPAASFMTNSGTESVEAAIKLAWRAIIPSAPSSSASWAPFTAGRWDPLLLLPAKRSIKTGFSR